jgi:hypothetical protein
MEPVICWRNPYVYFEASTCMLLMNEVPQQVEGQRKYIAFHYDKSYGYLTLSLLELG